MIRYLILLLLLIGNNAFSQDSYTISGYVKDKATGEELIGVSVAIGVSQGTTTNEYGFYSITLKKGTYQLVTSYIGYDDNILDIALTKDELIDFELQEQSTKLNEVVISAKGNNFKVETTEMSVAEIKAATIKKLPSALGEPDLLRSIQLLPGVSSVNDASSGINVRGGSADQNLILLDDATIYNASHLLGFFSVFNTNAIKDVKLYKGGIPSLYGGRLSSVLDVKQKEGNKKKLGGEIGIGLISSSLMLEGPIAKDENGIGKGSFMVAGRRSYLDLFLPLSSEFENTTLNFYDLNLKANYDLNSKNRLFLSGYFGRDLFKYNDVFGTTWGNSSGTLRWTNLINDKLFFQTSAIFSNYNYSLDNLRTGSEFRWNSNILNYNIKPRLSWFINSDHTIKTGIDATYYNFQPGKISALNESGINTVEFRDKYASEIAGYIDYKQKLSDRLTFQYGLRFSSFSRLGEDVIQIYESGQPLTYVPGDDIFVENKIIGQESYSAREVIKSYSGLEPRFSARFLLDEKSSLKLSYNRTNQYLHLISNTTSATPLDVWAPSGPYLKQQYADQVALGFVRNFNDNAYDINTEVYYKDLNNVTDFVDGADLLFTETIETQVAQGDGRAYGLEVQINKNKGKFTGWVSYTLARSERKILGINNNKYFLSNNDQLHELNLVGLYELNDRWTFGGNFIYGSGRPVTFPSSKYSQNGLVVADYQNRNGDRLPAYHRADFSATLHPKSGKRGTWIFSIANIYNRQNASSIFFRELSEVNGVEVATGKTEAVRLSYFGIVPSVMYQFKF